MIEFKNVSKWYGTNKVLNNVNLFIKEGSIQGCIGFSGAGKSTLLRCINQLEAIDEGQITINGEDIKTASKSNKIGIVFQQFNLLKQKTVFNNIKVILQVSGYPNDEIDERVNEVLDFVGLLDKKNEYPNNLSGGQMQRVGIARAIAPKPTILLCDEPTSALDPVTTKSVLDLIKKINLELGITVLIITHEMDVICDVCDRVAIMERGVIVEENTVYECFVNPQSDVTKDFVSSIISHEVPKFISPNDYDHIRQLIFDSKNVTTPVITHVAKLFEVDISILYGSVFEFKDYTIGSLIVNFSKCDDINAVYAYLKSQNVLVREV